MTDIANQDPYLYEYQNILTQTAYEGAATNYRKELQGLVYGTADNLAARELLLLQLRSSHAIRNNGYAATAIKKYVENLKSLSINWQTKKGKAHTKMQDWWVEFAENPMLDGYGNLDTWQQLNNSSHFRSGNSFTRYQIRRTGNPNAIPLKLDPIQSEFHDITYMGRSAGDNTYNGIQFEDTKPVNYFFLRSRIDTTLRGDNVNPYEHIVIPADELTHMFIRENPNQWLGIPMLAPVLIPLYNLDDLADATVAKQTAAQAISWIIENSNPMNLTPIGAHSIRQDEDNKQKVVFKVKSGGNVQYLNSGEKIHFYQSTDIGGNLLPFIQSELRRISAAAGLPYFQLTGDYSGIDFSTLRGICIELRNRIEFIHHFYTIPLSLLPLANKFKSLALLKDPKVATAFPTFQLPRFYGVDELKDAQADVLEVQSGLATLQSKLDERHTSFEEIAADREKIKEFGLDSILMNANPATKQNTNIQPNSNSTGNA